MSGRRTSGKWVAALGAGAALALAACGGGDDEGLSDAQIGVVDLFATYVEEDAEISLDMDRSCAEDAAADLSEDDATLIVESGGQPDGVSEEGLAAVDEMINCVDVGPIIEEMVAGFDEMGADGECVRELLEGMEPSEMLQDVDNLDVPFENCL